MFTPDDSNSSFYDFSYYPSDWSQPPPSSQLPSTRMQVAAVPQISTQSPLSVRSIGTVDDFDPDNLTPEERLRREFEMNDRRAKETAERRKKGEDKRANEEHFERLRLCKRYDKERQQKQEAEKKEMKDNMASQNGGFSNAISTMKTENNRKRKTDSEENPQVKMANHSQQHWQMQQMGSHYPSMYQRIPPNGTAPMQNGGGMYPPPFAPYPPCSQNPSSSSVAELAIFPDPSRMSNSPNVISSVSGDTATPPQNFKQEPTPPALVDNSSESNAYETFVKSRNNEPLPELKDILTPFLDQPETSENVQSVGTPSNVLSPHDGFQPPVNGPQSVHSIHQNPMSNGGALPMTPNNSQMSQPPTQPQQFSAIGTPMYTSTPKNAMAQMAQMANNPTGMAQPMNPQSMMSMNSLQSPQAMGIPSPHIQPAMQSPHIPMNLQSPGLPPPVMPTPPMPNAMAAQQMPPMGMQPIPWSQQWNMPGQIPNYPMPYPPMMQLNQMQHMQMVQHMKQQQMQQCKIVEQMAKEISPQYMQTLQCDMNYKLKHIEGMCSGQVLMHKRAEIHQEFMNKVQEAHAALRRQQYAIQQQQQQMMMHSAHYSSPGFQQYASYNSSYPTMQ